MPKIALTALAAALAILTLPLHAAEPDDRATQIRALLDDAALTPAQRAERVESQARGELLTTAKAGVDIQREAQATCAVTPITLAAVINGNLTTNSCIDGFGSREDLYSFTAMKGQTVTIEMSSSAFSVFLYMPGTTSETLSYLSSGVSMDRIVFTAPSTGTFRIEAESLWEATSSHPSTGPYTLKAYNGTPPPETFPKRSCGRDYPISCGGSQGGNLTYGSCLLDTAAWVDYYTFPGYAGDVVSVELNTYESSYTQPMVTILPPKGSTARGTFATGVNNATIIQYQIPVTGTWSLGVTSLDFNASGKYVVKLTCPVQCARPAIAIQPQHAFPARGASATLSVSATGSNLHYAWHPAGDPFSTIGGDAPTISIPGTGGVYYVDVSNACGSISSQSARVYPPTKQKRSSRK
jgi:hypothetical protein